MYMVSLLSILPFTAPACGSAQGGGEAPEAPKVYFVRDITPENMVRLYEALERPATGKVAVKLSTGEPGGHNFLKPELIKELVQKVDGTIVECNTAYGGGRASTENHLKAAADHGFTAIAPVDIMDAEGEVSLPVKGGRHLRENFVGSHYPAYDFTVVLSHFKGHAMGGFGGAVKNISIGIASSAGKAWIHSAGKTKNAAQMWGNLPAQDDFLESMAEAAKSVADHCGEKILYINVMNNLSVDCDCDAHPEDPKMGDIGILASTDPVALDKVSLPVKGGRHLRENFVGSHYPAYDFTVVLSHFKGHAMGGFGGAVKNISIGIASSAGKAWIHSAGKTKNAAQMWGNLPAQDDFLESMAEAAKSVADHCGEKILYINVMNNLSVDCDCDAHPEDPKMGDIGILASTDPVALDKACVDLVYASPDPGKVHLIERMESRHGIHTLEHGEAIGLGSQQYELVELE